MTSHNSFFGWIHSLKINQNNVVRGVADITQTPYPIIIAQPNLNQVIRNWNTADTGMVVCAWFAWAIFGVRGIRNSGITSLMERRRRYMEATTAALFCSLVLGLRNSMYRLQGQVPNGLKSTEVYEPVKYNYAGQFLRNSFWSIIFDDVRRPTK